MGDSRLCVHSVRLPGPGDAAPPGGPPGSVFVADGRMKVRCAEGWVIVERLQAACRRAMSTEDWLRGCREEPCGVLAEEPTST